MLRTCPVRHTPPVCCTPQGALSEEGLRDLVAQQLAAATRDILAQQAALLAELRGQPQVCACVRMCALGEKALGRW